MIAQPGDLHQAAYALNGRRAAGALLAPRRMTQLAPWLFLTRWLIGSLAITLGPMLVSLYLSFTDYNLLGQTNWVGLDNYVRALSDDHKFVAAVAVTLNYVLVSVPLQLAFALAIAVLLNQGLAGLALYRSIYYLPSLLGSSVAIALFWRQRFGVFGACQPGC